MNLNPLSLTRRVAGMTLGTGVRMVSRVVELVARDGRDDSQAPAQAPPARSAGRPAPRTTEAAPPATPPAPAAPAAPPAASAPPAAPSASAPPPPPPEPDELVATSADPGAEADVGPNLHVDAPWPEYDAMRAADIVDRLVVADAATLAAVQLYEATHRDRRTVIEAARRQLARA